MSLIDKIDKTRAPQHIAIIMDGNGRWAKARDLDRTEGHKEGVNSVRKIVEASANAGVRFLTIYAFSTENWKRPKEEINALMNLMVYAISKETPDLIKNGIRLQCIGDTDRLPKETREELFRCIEKTAQGNTLTLALALSYSSKWEIAHAAKEIAKAVQMGKLKEQDINESIFEKYLSTFGIPNPDLLIRTGGEQRISNFLLWQAAYSELYFTDTYWPDFNDESLYEAILDYQHRERRFGKTSEQIQQSHNPITEDVKIDKK